MATRADSRPGGAPPAVVPGVAAVVYTRAGCAPCAATVRAMARHGLPVRQVPLDEQTGAEEIEAFKAAGLVSVPVVVTETATWSGFRPDLIRTLAHNQHTESQARATAPAAQHGPGVPASARAAGLGI
ncbi:hypothetical protein GCG21_15615 [Pseudactinotalea sp. HY160]|uniref:glutaredoxin domain-containing protein n=1 Tax=Pseudactinotalea sp. HY160 TaxID=2654490 RepID=UPI00128CCEF0|nr:glutaredoxin domain-containing protein [Pseudactinotalea sp. HY160]MPV51412.1 hypothetical protein [Pseudactinotalea sp. HY160]